MQYLMRRKSLQWKTTLKGNSLVQEYKDRYVADKARRDKIVWIRIFAKTRAIRHRQEDLYYQEVKDPIVLVTNIAAKIITLVVLLVTVFLVVSSFTEWN